MKQDRLGQLTDGIFAIVMTLLIFEIRLPRIDTPVTNESLLYGLEHTIPLFLSYLLSFLVLFTFWKSHHFIVSIYAKNIDLEVTNSNAVFLFFVALIPFTSHVLGQFPNTEVGIGIYALNIVAIGLALFWMRHHILYSQNIENPSFTRREMRNGAVRVMLPVVCAILAFGLSFWSTTLALVILTFSIMYNLFPQSSKLNNTFLDPIWPVPEDKKTN